MTKYDPPSYRLYLQNSIINGNNKHILVEGKDDKYLIERLWEDFNSKNNCNLNIKIIVDSADNLIQKELSGISWVKKDKLLYSFINSWIKKSLEARSDYPLAIFELLGVDL
ncbi:hypothetical protein [Spirulina sp. 06S082]|uniref:hypothetical protein n=1 Tax=Spirulina sp. 06S082 TaxID=3110248 RepID=UPI002B21258A|nr:hypothetical protein [Spirulina sp. 06S082]MEA5467966.1 hypothetical protein [Spirulina sp. 06S082]